MPNYMVQPSDLVPYTGTCPRCGGPKPLLVPRVPEDRHGDTSYAELGGLTRFIRPYADHFPCSHCELKAAVARLFPGPRPSPFESDLEREVRRLCEQLAGPPPAEAEAEHPGALFTTGTTYPTPSALAILADVNDPQYRADVGGGWERGRPFLGDLLARFVRGDLGSVGRIDDGDPDRGEQQGPLASPLDQAAAHVRSGSGMVRGVYDLRRDVPAGWRDGQFHQSETHRGMVVARTVLPGAPVLIHAAGELD